MQTLLRHQFWIVAIAALVFFVNLGSVGLWDEDEPLYAAIALDMHQRADWIVPMYNGEMFPEKPPLAYWLMMVGFKMFGVTELATRFWSAVFGVGTALVTYHLGRRLFDAQVGFWAALVTTTTLIFTVNARAATVDSVLVFFTTLAMLLFVLAGMVRPEEDEVAEAGEKQSTAAKYRSGPWWLFALLYACLGLTVLTKGPIGLVLPVAMLGFYLLVMHHLRSGDDWFARRRAWLEQRFPPVEARRVLSFGWQLRMLRAIGASWLVGLVAALRPFRPGKLLRTAWQLRPISCVVIVTAIAAPWFVLVGIRTEGEFLRKFFIEQNLGRALNAMQGHSGPFWYYIPAIMIGFFPWALFLLPSLLRLAGEVRRRSPLRAAHVFVACWIGVFVFAWSVPTTKLPHYVLTAYPALALMTGCFVRGWIVAPERTHPGWLRSATTTMVLVGVGVMIAFPVAAMIFVPGEGFLALFGLTLIVGAGLFAWLRKRDRRQAAMISFAATSVVFLVSMFGIAALRIDRFQTAKPMLAEIRQSQSEPYQLAGYHFLRESFVFYAGQKVAYFEDTQRLAEFLQTADNPVVLTSNKCEQELQEAFPGQFRVLARRPRFLRRGEILALVPCREAPAARTAARAGGAIRK